MCLVPLTTRSKELTGEHVEDLPDDQLPRKPVENPFEDYSTLRSAKSAEFIQTGKPVENRSDEKSTLKSERLNNNIKYD